MNAEIELQLLRRFEPVLRFTRGEEFFPMDVEPYVRACSLWMQRPTEEAVCLVPQGELTLENLGKPPVEGFQTVYFLRFIEPLDILNFIAYIREKRKKSGPHKTFRFGFGRLARVGYSSRFADLLFSLSLLLRGRVPGDAGAAAALEYARIMEIEGKYCYHGRVIRQGDWLVVQYWFFYAFNNWRSGFFGVNDHEGDWEMLNVYLYEKSDGEWAPEWVAYASHDFSGDDLRRRWDDPEVKKVGEHPLVYPGAGSHASYFAPGEYLAEIELPFLSPLARGWHWVNHTWHKLMGQAAEALPSGQSLGLEVLRVPFVDFARGDGLSLGPGGEREWDAPRLLDPLPGWVSQFIGLWGLYARDPISGENAPAGPMYNRDGSVRRGWCDPVGWAGLDKVPPPNRALEHVHRRKAELEKRQEACAEEIEQKSAALLDLGVTAAAIRDHPQYRLVDIAQADELASLSDEVSRLRQQQAEGNRLLETLNLYEKRLLASEREPSRAHIHRAHQPASAQEMRINRLVELWAAVSIGLMMIGFVALVLFYSQHLLLGLVVMISVFIFIESGFRRQLDQLINSVAISLALVATLVILFEFFWKIVVFAVLFAGLYILWENVKELAAR